MLASGRATESAEKDISMPPTFDHFGSKNASTTVGATAASPIDSGNIIIETMVQDCTSASARLAWVRYGSDAAMTSLIWSPTAVAGVSARLSVVVRAHAPGAEVPG